MNFSLRTGAAALLASLLAVAAWSTTQSDVEKARAFYRSQPRYLRPVLGDARVPGLTDLRAATCGTCHAEIYAEWRISTHARAWKDDAQFQEELKKHVGGAGASDASWMCWNCHTPFEAQLERLVVGLESGHRGKPEYIANPAFDPKLQLEAITCATCHVRDGVIVGPYGDTVGPHPVRKDPALLSSGVCIECHQASANLDDVALACVFDTGLEHSNTDGAKAGETCQSCHMPEVFRALSSYPPTSPRKGRRHFFGGSLIPKHPSFEKDIAKMRPFFKDGLAVEWVELPEKLVGGSKTKVRFAATNAEAGHMLPTGDPERYITIDVVATDDEGKEIGRSSERIGAVYRWEPLEKLADTRLAPKERREYEMELAAPKSGAVTLTLVASKWRISPENFAYHELAGRYVAGNPFLKLETKLSIGE